MAEGVLKSILELQTWKLFVELWVTLLSPLFHHFLVLKDIMQFMTLHSMYSFVSSRSMDCRNRNLSSQTRLKYKKRKMSFCHQTNCWWEVMSDSLMELEESVGNWGSEDSTERHCYTSWSFATLNSIHWSPKNSFAAFLLSFMTSLSLTSTTVRLVVSQCLNTAILPLSSSLSSSSCLQLLLCFDVSVWRETSVTQIPSRHDGCRAF